MGLFNRRGDYDSTTQSNRKMHLFYFAYLNQILTSKGASKDMLLGGLGSLNQIKLESCPFDNTLEQRINYLLDTINDVLPTMRLAGRGANLEVSSIRKVEPTIPYREDYWTHFGQRNSIEVARKRQSRNYWNNDNVGWDGDTKHGGWNHYLTKAFRIYGKMGGLNTRSVGNIAINSHWWNLYSRGDIRPIGALITNRPDSGLREYENVRVDGVEVHYPFEREGWGKIQRALDVQNYDRILFFPRIRCVLSWGIEEDDTSPGLIVFIPENASANSMMGIEIGNRGGGYYEKAWDQQIEWFKESFIRYKTSLLYLEDNIHKGIARVFGEDQKTQKQRIFLNKIRDEFSVIEIRLNKGVRNMLINWPDGVDE